MGPAQFIPCTWERYTNRVTSVTGNSPANPWNLIDAFTAAALYLSDYGASQKTRAAEDAAARAYVSGSPACRSAVCNGYASAVLQTASLIEISL
jgi:membrane-bound lytic murein transglycosylase B